MDYSEGIRKLILKEIENCSLRHKDIAKKVNITPSALSKYLHGKSSLDLNTVLKLTNLLDINLKEIFEYGNTRIVKIEMSAVVSDDIRLETIVNLLKGLDIKIIKYSEEKAEK